MPALTHICLSGLCTAIHIQAYRLIGCGRCKTFICAHIHAYSLCGGGHNFVHTQTQATLPTILMGVCGGGLK